MFYKVGPDRQTLVCRCAKGTTLDLNGIRRVMDPYILTVVGGLGLCLAVVRVPSMHHCFVEAAILALFGINASQLAQYATESSQAKHAMQYVWEQVCTSLNCIIVLAPLKGAQHIMPSQGDVQVSECGTTLKSFPEVMFSDNAKQDQQIPERVTFPILKEMLRRGSSETDKFRLQQVLYIDGEYRKGEVRQASDVTVPLALYDNQLYPRGMYPGAVHVDKELSELLTGAITTQTKSLLINLFSPPLAQDIYHLKERVMTVLKRYAGHLT